MKKNSAIAFCLFCASALCGDVKPSVWFETPTNVVLRLEIAHGFKVFAESVEAEAFTIDDAQNGVILSPRYKPQSERLEFASDTNDFYLGSALFVYDLPLSFTNEHKLAITYQACGEEVCYLPKTIEFVSGENFSASPEREIDDAEYENSLPRTISGYFNADEFLRFLNPEANRNTRGDIIERVRKKGGVLLLLLAAIVAGASLNLTPCVLPLIPVNIALIGRGAKRGAAFGFGIALVFGAAGLISALTGAALGFIQASAIFNAGAAIVFCVLALAMLDALKIDFSGIGNFAKKLKRSQPQKTKNTEKQLSAVSLFGAFAGGAFSALLSGACVAPVLISTLVISADMAGRGEFVGYILPFALGIGMGLPWPFIGGGVMTLPRAGAWMMRVKRVFAIIFIAMALRFLLTAYHILRPTEIADDSPIVWVGADAAFSSDKPTLVYLTADWCAACRELSASTFKDPKVVSAMENFNAVKIDCTVFNDPAVKAWLKKTGARGLPHIAVWE